MADQTPTLRQLVREVRDAKEFRKVALNHLQTARMKADSEAMLAASQVVEFASGRVTDATNHLLDHCGYSSIALLLKDINLLLDDELEYSVNTGYALGQRQALEGIMAYAEDELSEF